MKLKFVPSPSVPAGTTSIRSNTAVGLALVGIDSNSTDLGYWENTNIEQLLEKGTVINIDAARPWKKYFDFKKYSASMKLPWAKTSDANPDA